MRPVMPKEPRLLMPKFLAAARGQECFLQIHGVCDHGTETTVAAHSEQYCHGHCRGKKAHDIFIIYACVNCHDWIDGRRYDISKDERTALFNSQWPWFIAWAVREGLLKC